MKTEDVLAGVTNSSKLRTGKFNIEALNNSELSLEVMQYNETGHIRINGHWDFWLTSSRFYNIKTGQKGMHVGVLLRLIQAEIAENKPQQILYDTTLTDKYGNELSLNIEDDLSFTISQGKFPKLEHFSTNEQGIDRIIHQLQELKAAKVRIMNKQLKLEHKPCG